MIRNEICCDICGYTVAAIRKGLLRKKITIRKPYLEMPSHLLNGTHPAVHICKNCMEKYVYKALDEKMEQSK